MGSVRTYIGTIWRIFVRDLRLLVKNPIALIVVAGVCILPALYAWYTVAAFWDPYQNTQAIQVAVVNEDEGADSAYAGKMDVGAQVVDELKDNHEIGWQFVDRDQATQGVEAGDYYAAVVMPKDFSADFVSVFTGNFQKPQIELYVNEKKTASGVKVAEAGAEALEKKINEQFVSTVSGKVVDILKTAEHKIDAQGDTVQGALTQGVQEATAAIASSRSALEDLEPVLADARTATQEGTDALGNVTGAIPGLESDLDATEQAIAQTRSALGAYSADIAKNASAASTALSEAAARTAATAGTVAGRMSQAKGSVDAAIDEAERVVAANDDALEDLRNQQQAGTAGLDQTIASLEAQNASLNSTLGALRTASSDLAASADGAAQAVQSVSQAMEDAAAGLRDASDGLQRDVVPQLESSLDALAAATGTLRGVLVSVSPAATEAQTALESLGGTIDEAQASTSASAEALAVIEQRMNTCLTDLTALSGSASIQEIARALGMDEGDAASFMASPVKLHTNVLFPVKNYGSGVAPFFTNLALWVSGFILMAMVRMRVDRKGLPPFTPTQAYFGRWLMYAMLGLAQGFVVGVGDIVIGMQCESPVAFVGACMLSGFAYVNLMYGLEYSMRHIGKAISVILLVIQIPGSSGMFPVEMLPQFYQAINPLLPFTYSIDAMRQAVGGFYGLEYLKCMLVMALVYVPIGFVVGLGIGKAAFNLNILFDRKLDDTNLFQSEETAGMKPRFRLHAVVRALLDTKQYRTYILERAARFDRLYPTLARIGWVAAFATPVAMMALLIVVPATPDGKLMLLMWFFVALVVVAAYLVVLSFLHSDISYQLGLAEKDDGELRKALGEGVARQKNRPHDTPDVPAHDVPASAAHKDEGRGA